MASKTTAVSNPDDDGDQPRYLAHISDSMAIGEVMKSNMGDTMTVFDFVRISIPAGGGKQFTVPKLEGDEDVSYIDGIIVGWRTMRAYWEQEFEQSGGGVPPDCSSQDGITGHGNPGGDCSECFLNVYGTARGGTGRGKACKEMRALFVLTPDSQLPYMFLMPPSSIKPIKNYMLRLTTNSMPYWHAVTRFELKRVQNKDSINYSELAPQFVRRLDDDEREAATRYKAELSPVIEGTVIELTSDDYTEAEAPFPD